jgi:signal transduction histidine kinase
MPVERYVPQPYITKTDITNNRVKRPINFSGPITPHFLDINNDNKLELIVTEQLPSKNRIRIFNAQLDSVTSFIFPDIPGLQNGTTAHAKGVLDIDRDGQNEILFTVFTNNNYQPRGVYAYDYVNHKLKWKFLTGTHVEEMFIKDIDQDGIEEIILSSASPYNGKNKINGTDDKHVYIIVLENDGSPKIMQELGGFFQDMITIPKDLDQDGIYEAIVIKKSRTTNEQSLFGIYNFNSRLLSYQRKFHYIISNGTGFIDADDDGMDEFLIFHETGKIEIRNFENDILFQHNGFGNLFQRVMIEDFIGNGEPEILLTSSDGLFLYSKQLTLLAHYPLNTPNIDLLEMGQGKRGVLAWHPNYFYQFVIQRNKSSFISSILYLLVIISCSMFVIFLFVFHKKRKHSSSTLNDNYSLLKKLDHGVVFISQNGLVTFLNDSAQYLTKLDSLPVLPESFPVVFYQNYHTSLTEMIKEALDKQQDRLRKTIELNGDAHHKILEVTAFGIFQESGGFSGVMLFFDNVTEVSQSENAKNWARIAQRLAHQMKTPLSSIMLSVQRLQMEFQKIDSSQSGNIDKYVGYVQEEVKKLRSLNDGFMKFAQLENPEKTKTDFNELVQKVINSADHISGKDLHFNMELDKNKVLRLDANQIEIVLKIILENAIDAIQKKGQITIHSGLVQSLYTENKMNNSDFLNIEISDTGIGIPEPYLNKLFDVFFTTKQEGTGLGLAIALKIIHDHNGSIKIASTEGLGTTVSIKLPFK